MNKRIKAADIDEGTCVQVVGYSNQYRTVAAVQLIGAGFSVRVDYADGSHDICRTHALVEVAP